MGNLHVDDWTDYALLDFGFGRKLEQFGSYVVDRPESLADGPTVLTEQEWERRTHARYEGPETGKGEWVITGDMPNEWKLPYSALTLQFELSLSPFKHVGIFPEQASNWKFIIEQLNRIPNASVLNLFAYTGAASLVAASHGARVTHVDSSKSVVTKARENMVTNGLSDIRWIVDDAVTFAERELRRGNTYEGIILDPPAFGRGPKGKIWKLADHLPQLLETVAPLLDKRRGFLILNTYSPILPEEETHDMVARLFPGNAELQTHWLAIKSVDGRMMPLSIVNRLILNNAS